MVLSHLNLNVNKKKTHSNLKSTISQTEDIVFIIRSNIGSRWSTHII